MTKINVIPDCGNAPRKTFLRDFNIAFATGDADFIVEHVSDHITWEMVGDKTISGKEALSQAIHEMKDYTADESHILHMITHGKSAVLTGVIKMDGKTYDFCDVYEFVSAGKNILKHLKSYEIKTKG